MWIPIVPPLDITPYLRAPGSNPAEVTNRNARPALEPAHQPSGARQSRRACDRRSTLLATFTDKVRPGFGTLDMRRQHREPVSDRAEELTFRETLGLRQIGAAQIGPHQQSSGNIGLVEIGVAQIEIGRAAWGEVGTID